MKKNPPKLTLIEESAEDREREREEFAALIDRLSPEQMLIALERLQQLALNEKTASPVRRRVRKDRIRTERAGKFKLIQ